MRYINGKKKFKIIKENLERFSTGKVSIYKLQNVNSLQNLISI